MASFSIFLKIYSCLNCSSNLVRNIFYICNFSTVLLNMTMKANEELYLFMVIKIIMEQYLISSEIKSGCGAKAIFSPRSIPSST